jgi:hypoxanthine-guanine phosphoribosyltransferase
LTKLELKPKASKEAIEKIKNEYQIDDQLTMHVNDMVDIHDTIYELLLETVLLRSKVNDLGLYVLVNKLKQSENELQSAYTLLSPIFREISTSSVFTLDEGE